MNIRNILGFSIGPVFTALLGFATVPITAWIFSPQDVARLNLLQVALSFCVQFFSLGLDQAYVREYHEVEDKSELLYGCFMPGFLVLMLVGSCTLFFSDSVSDFLYDVSDPTLYYLTFLVFIVGYLSRFLSLILRMQERGWAYSMSQVLPKLLQLILLLAIFLLFTVKSFILLEFVTLFSLISALLVYVGSTKKHWLGAFRSGFNISLQKKLFAFGFPLVFSGIAYWGLTTVCVIVLRIFTPLEELAIYSVASSFAGAAVIFQSIFSVVWAPTVYKWASRGDDLAIVDQIALQVLAIVCVIFALCGCFSWICSAILPEKYASVEYMLPCMLMQPLLYALSEVTSIGIGIQRKTLYLVLVTFCSFVVNSLLAYFLAARLGAVGAAISNAIAFAVFFILKTELSVRVWRRFPRGKIYSIVLAILFSSVATALAGNSNQMIVHLFWIIFLVVAIVIFREQWKQLYLFKR